MPNKIDLAGQVFGRLIAIEPTEERRGGQVVWRCLCNCGTETYSKNHFVASNPLRRGSTRSCGCSHVEWASRHAEMTRKLPVVSMNKLIEQYQDGMSLNDLAASNGVCAATISKWLDSQQVPRRSLSDAGKLDFRRRRKIRLEAIRKAIVASLAQRRRSGETYAYLHTQDVRRKIRKSRRTYLKKLQERRQSEREQAEAIERSLNGETFK